MTTLTAPLAEEVLVTLVRRGLPDAEVFLKRGRSRRLERTLFTEASSTTPGEGLGGAGRPPHRGSFFAAGAASPPRPGPWPEP